jgi:hypothetical protein
MSEWSASRPAYRGLWASVVLQALDDIWGQPMGSIDFLQAAAFFTGAGAWAESRTIIGDFLELHRDDLEALGKRCIDARHTRESLPPEKGRRSPSELSEALLILSGPVAFPQRAKLRALPSTGAAISRISRVVCSSAAK